MAAMELAIESVDSRSRVSSWLTVRCYPGVGGPRIQSENRKPRNKKHAADTTDRAAGRLREPQRTGCISFPLIAAQQHGFLNGGPITEAKRFADWTVFEEGGEAMLIGGDMGAGILQWALDAEPQSGGTRLRAGFGFRKDTKVTAQPEFEVTPGEAVETPIAFLALAKGDEDDAANAAFHYLKRFVFPAPLPNSPLAVYCIWYTVPRSEELLLEELKFARRIGFEVFYHDASWYEGSSVVPGTNDWSLGLGSYRENLKKFPNGMAEFSRTVRSAGMKFGLWVDPGNVDSNRVASGEIPEKWLAKIDGKPLQSKHPVSVADDAALSRRSRSDRLDQKESHSHH